MNRPYVTVYKSEERFRAQKLLHGTHQQLDYRAKLLQMGPDSRQVETVVVPQNFG